MGLYLNLHHFISQAGYSLVDNDISPWQTQANRQIHVGRDEEKREQELKN